MIQLNNWKLLFVLGRKECLMEYCYVEFNKKNNEKLKKLVGIVEIMKKDKEEGKTNIDEEWIKLFTDDELDQYWWPNIDQYDEVKKLFGDLLIKLSDKKDNPREDWDIYSMFEAISGSEYELIGIREISTDIYRLEFNLFHTPMVEHNLFKSLLVLWDILLQR